MSAIRAFIAISLSPEIHQKLGQLMDGLRARLPRAPVRWVQPQNIHLTVKFLGDVSTASQEMLTKMLAAEASRHPCFEVSVGELGVFPSPHRPKIIWVGVEAPQELHGLYRLVENEMMRLGYAPEERPFSPHLTIGRVSRSAKPEEYRQIGETVKESKVGFLGALRVTSVELFRSDLRPGGAVYTRLFSAPLMNEPGPSGP